MKIIYNRTAIVFYKFMKGNDKLIEIIVLFIVWTVARVKIKNNNQRRKNTIEHRHKAIQKGIHLC